MNYLKLTLSGVLQYYADTNQTSLKTTYNTSIVPTKSAVIGLIASAIGVPRKSDKLKYLYDNITTKFKVITAGYIFEDFQSIKPLKSQNNYMNKFYTRNKFTTSNGGYRDISIIKNIQYIQDAEFEVYVSASDELLKIIFDAIQNPEYSLYFGKRSCIPNKPIVTEFNLIKEEDLTDVYDCA